MPMKWVPPQVFLKYRGVTVYHTYKNDNINMPPRNYAYGWREDCCDERDSFDVRDLPNPRGHDLETDKGKRAVLREAIDTGILTKDGIVSNEESEPFLTLQVPSGSWKVLVETLRLDARSSAFDPELRHSIQQALDRLQVVSEPSNLLDAARDVLQWAERMGGWEDKCWQRLKNAVNRASCRKETDHLDPHAALKRIFDVMYVETDEHGRDRCYPNKSWSADTLEEIADIVRPFFPELSSAPPETSSRDKAKQEDGQ